MDVILASNSPRRRQLLGLTGMDFRVVSADVDETPLHRETPLDYVQRLAIDKAQVVVRAQSGSKTLVIAADTTVVDGGKILGKPLDDLDAARMLRQLRGRTHQVYTAIAVIYSGKLVTDVCETQVPMRQYRNDEIQAYIATRDPVDKAGAYAIQHPEFRPVEQLQGCYANVVGLPLCHLARTFHKIQISLDVDIPQACQESLGYVCPIYEMVLREQV